MRIAIQNFLCASINESENHWREHFNQAYHEHAQDLYLNVYDYLGLDAVPGVYFPAQTLWQKSYLNAIDSCKRKSLSTESAEISRHFRELHKDAQQVVEQLAQFPKDLYALTYNCKSNKHSCIKILLTQLSDNIKQVNSASERKFKRGQILSLIERFHETAWQIIKPNTVVRVGNHDQLARTKSSEAQLYIEQQARVAESYKNPVALRAKRILGLPLVPPTLCTYSKVYLVQAAGCYDYAWITDCSCKMHREMRSRLY